MIPYHSRVHHHDGDVFGGDRQVDVGSGVFHGRFVAQQLAHFAAFRLL